MTVSASRMPEDAKKHGKSTLLDGVKTAAKVIAIGVVLGVATGAGMGSAKVTYDFLTMRSDGPSPAATRLPAKTTNWVDEA